MAIQTTNAMKSILNEYNARDWVKSAKLNSLDELNLSELKTDDLFDKRKTPSFSEMLADSVAEVNSLQKQANVAMEKLVTGQSEDLDGTLLAADKAFTAFQAMNKIRTKVIDAYREIMRMQV
jgi:flagellar hook-basal body complex protein FliE